MKKILLIAATRMMFSSCAKDVATPTENKDQMQTAALTADGKTRTGGQKPVRANATVMHDGDIREGGRGWFLQVSKYEWEMPINLPEEFKVENLAVDVAYVRTDKSVPNRYENGPKYMVEIKDISRLNEPAR